MREISKVLCNCGGSVEEVATTTEEQEKYGCHRDKFYRCCVTAYQCDKCGVRFTFAFEAPEVIYE